MYIQLQVFYSSVYTLEIRQVMRLFSGRTGRAGMTLNACAHCSFCGAIEQCCMEVRQVQQKLSTFKIYHALFCLLLYCVTGVQQVILILHSAAAGIYCHGAGSAEIAAITPHISTFYRFRHCRGAH